MNADILNKLVKNADQFGAHVKKDKQKDQFIIETLPEHSVRTGRFFHKICEEKDFDGILERFRMKMLPDLSEKGKAFLYESIYAVPLMHDIGKINPNFQCRLLKNTGIKVKSSLSGRVDHTHSLLSSILYMNYFTQYLRSTEAGLEKKEKGMLRPYILLNAYVISRHHSSLSSFAEYWKALNTPSVEELFRILSEKQEIAYTQDMKLSTKKLKNYFDDFYKIQESFSNEQNIAVYYYVKLLYSILVASDYYATAEFMNDLKEIRFETLDACETWQEKFESSKIMKKVRTYQRENYPQDPEILKNGKDINVLRSELLCEAEETMKKNRENALFYLEAPTGSGKSNTAIDLTFTLMKEDKSLKKVFYIYPFNTLVEQNMQSLKKIFGEESEEYQEIAVINSVTPIKVDQKKQLEDDQEEQAVFYQKALLNRQFLNYPMILSTHVSLFDTFFGASRESAFGFHQLCNSVVILDEIQSYKNSIWGQMIYFLKEAAELLNIKLILMSATLPDLDLLTEKMFPGVSLIADREKYFSHPCFKNRVEPDYELLGSTDVKEDLLRHVKNQLLDGKKVLMEFIKKSSAEDFYRTLKEDQSVSDQTEYMSGDDNLMERSRILERIKTSSEPVLLVATQVVEAGIDVDMDVGYKNISKLDSEEQFMGRVNRSCLKDHAKVYFFKLDDSKKIYGPDEIRTNKEITLENDEIKAILSGKDFPSYYKLVLSSLKDNLYNNCVTGLDPFFQEQVGYLNFHKVADTMKLIDEDRWSMSVYLGRDMVDENGKVISGSRIWEEYKELLEDYSMDFSEKKIRLSRIKSIMNNFIYQIKKNPDLIYNDKIGELLYIEDGDKYFDNGKINRKKLQGEIGEFVDFI